MASTATVVDLVRVRRRSAVAVGVGNFMEWFDFAVYGLFATTIGRLFFPNTNPAVSLLSSLAVFGVAFFMRPLGGFVLGSLADRKGRRWALTATVGMMGATTTLIGVLPTYGQIGILAPALLVLLRCLQGFSAGGEWTGSSAFLLEYTPPRRRGLLGSVISSTAAVAIIVGCLAALALESTLTSAEMSAWGWRVPFLAATPLGLIGLYIRLKIDETPVFRQLRERGAVERTPLRTGSRHDLKPILLTFAFASVQGLGYYYLATYLITFLTQKVGLHRPAALALSAAGITLYALLCPLAGVVADRFGRRPVNVLGSAAMAVLAYPAFLLIGSGGAVPVLVGILLFSVCQSMVSVTTVVMLTELFPAARRGSGSAIGFNLALALIGGPGPFIATAIGVASANRALPSVYMVAVAFLGFLAVLRWLPETRDRMLGLESAGPTVDGSALPGARV